MSPEISPDARHNDPGWRSRLTWLVVDRVVLGLVVVILGFVLNAYLQRDQRVGDYQKLLFEKRVKAYEELTAVARAARDRCALAHRQFLATPAMGWQARFAAAGDGIWLLAERRAGDIGGGAGDVGSSAGSGDSNPPAGAQLYEWQASVLTDAIKTLREVERKRTEGSLYISGSVNARIDKLLETLFGDLEALERRIGKKKGPFFMLMSSDDKQFLEHAVLHAEESYNNLFLAIADALRVKEVILG